MTQRQVDIYKQQLFSNKSDKNLSIIFTQSKKIEVYYSKSYKQFVVSFKLGSKKFIIDKKKWIYFRLFLNKIDDIIINQ
jgi:hypothetical protein